jgi:hypothetical protein
VSVLCAEREWKARAESWTSRYNRGIGRPADARLNGAGAERDFPAFPSAARGQSGFEVVPARSDTGGHPDGCLDIGRLTSTDRRADAGAGARSIIRPACGETWRRQPTVAHERTVSSERAKRNRAFSGHSGNAPQRGAAPGGGARG